MSFVNFYYFITVTGLTLITIPNSAMDTHPAFPYKKYVALEKKLERPFIKTQNSASETIQDKHIYQNNNEPSEIPHIKKNIIKLTGPVRICHHQQIQKSDSINSVKKTPMHHCTWKQCNKKYPYLQNLSRHIKKKHQKPANGSNS